MYETHESFVTPEFCQRLRAKEGTAWERLVNEWRESFIELAKGSLYRLGNSSTDPKDIVADMWSKAWIESHKLKGQSEGELYVWLKFKLVEVLPRHPKPQLSLDQPSADDTTALVDTLEDKNFISNPVQDLISQEDVAIIREAIQELPQSHLPILELCEKGHTVAEIAESLRCSQSEVWNILKYARKKLREKLRFRLPALNVGGSEKHLDDS